MNFEIFAIIGLVLFVFFLIQIAKMKTFGADSEEMTSKAMPAFVTEVTEDKMTNIDTDEYKTDIINSDSVR